MLFAVLTILEKSWLMVTHGKGNTLEEIKKHRTKCKYLIKSIILPVMEPDLIDEMQEICSYH